MLGAGLCDCASLRENGKRVLFPSTACLVGSRQSERAHRDVPAHARPLRVADARARPVGRSLEQRSSPGVSGSRRLPIRPKRRKRRASSGRRTNLRARAPESWAVQGLSSAMASALTTPVCFSALYFMNMRGDVLLERQYRDDVTRQMAQAFKTEIINGRETGPRGGTTGMQTPVVNLGACTFMYLSLIHI